jgi:hypothetical protein
MSDCPITRKHRRQQPLNWALTLYQASELKLSPQAQARLDGDGGSLFQRHSARVEQATCRRPALCTT